MLALVIKNPRSRMTSFPCRLAVTLRDRQSCKAAPTDLRAAPIHSARPSLLRLIFSPACSAERPADVVNAFAQAIRPTARS
jgi:hypothetical protein